MASSEQSTDDVDSIVSAKDSVIYEKEVSVIDSDNSFVHDQRDNASNSDEDGIIDCNIDDALDER